MSEQPHMWNLASNNLSLSDHDPTVPKTERMALERRRLKEERFRKKVTAATISRESQRAVQLISETNALRAFTPKMRFITRENGMEWEILTVYEVVWQEWGKLIVKIIYEDNGGLYGSTREGVIEVSVGWLQKNILAMPMVWWLSWISLIPYIQESDSQKQDRMVPQTDGLMVNTKNYNPRWHSGEIRTLDYLFFSDKPETLISEISEKKIVISATPYKKAYSYKWDPIPWIVHGEWFFVSLQYDYALEQIFQKFFGKRVRIAYRGITYENQENEQSLEYDQDPIVWDVSAIEKDWRMNHNVISLLDATREDTIITHIPYEAFCTGFTIELIED